MQGGSADDETGGGDKLQRRCNYESVAGYERHAGYEDMLAREICLRRRHDNGGDKMITRMRKFEIHTGEGGKLT